MRLEMLLNLYHLQQLRPHQLLLSILLRVDLLYFHHYSPAEGLLMANLQTPQ